jgi:hypothetical protein
MKRLLLMLLLFYFLFPRKKKNIINPKQNFTSPLYSILFSVYFLTTVTTTTTRAQARARDDWEVGGRTSSSPCFSAPLSLPPPLVVVVRSLFFFFACFPQLNSSCSFRHPTICLPFFLPDSFTHSRFSRDVPIVNQTHQTGGGPRTEKKNELIFFLLFSILSPFSLRFFLLFTQSCPFL